jgi:hypothetical protein
MRILESVYQTIDLSEALDRALSAISTMRGIPALIFSVSLLYANYHLLPLVWYYDLESTAAWMSQFASNFKSPDIIWKLISNQASWTEVNAAAAGVGYGIVALTLVPTIVEVLGSRFARFRFTLAGILVLALAAFDLITDWPRVAESSSGLQAIFNDIPVIGGVLFFLFRMLLLIAASFGGEMWLIVTTVCAIYLMFLGLMSLSSSSSYQTQQRLR